MLPPWRAPPVGRPKLALSCVVICGQLLACYRLRLGVAAQCHIVEGHCGAAGHPRIVWCASYNNRLGMIVAIATICTGTSRVGSVGSGGGRTCTVSPNRVWHSAHCPGLAPLAVSARGQLTRIPRQYSRPPFRTVDSCLRQFILHRRLSALTAPTARVRGVLTAPLASFRVPGPSQVPSPRGSWPRSGRARHAGWADPSAQR